MKKGVLFYTMIILATFGLMFTVSCGKQQVVQEPTTTEPPPPVETTPAPVAQPEPTLAPEPTPVVSTVDTSAEDRFQSVHIYFEFDSAVLLPQAQNTLRQKAEFLRMNPGYYLVVEGHCDERGTNAYNLALGERRALSARSFLADLGVEETRIETISYGEERPLDAYSGEEAWAKNRRAQFLLQ